MTRRLDPNDPHAMEVTIAGIPALIDVTDTERDFDGGWRFSWEIHDRKGYPAPWLQAKLTPRAERDIEQQILDRLAWAERERQEYRRAVRLGMEDCL